MKHSIAFLLTLLPTIVIAAPNSTMSFQGYGGLINTPSAELLEEGSFYFQYGNQVESRGGYKSGSNYNFGIGLWQHVEVSARLADYNYGGENDLTDLSANVKFGIPYIPEDWFSLAVGIQDLGGAANFFDAKYLVATKNIFESINVSLGVGKSDSLQGRLDGIFSGVEWQPLDWGKLSLEYDGADTNLGLHLFTPKNLFDSGVQVSTNLLVTSSNKELTDDVYYGVGITVPLEQTSHNKKSSHSKKSRYQSQTDITTEEGSAKVVDRSGTLEKLTVKKLLAKEGFSAITVGEADLHTVYIELENHIYNRNQIDGIGVALGIISSHIQHNYSHFKLVLKEREIPVIAISGSLAEYEGFLKDNQPLKLDITTDTFNSQKRIPTADITNEKSYLIKPRLTLRPGVISTVGTEVGVFDASFALLSHLEVPLWTGAALTAEHTWQLAETKDFKDGEIFSDRKHKTGLSEYSFNQTFSLPFNMKNMLSLGRYRDTYNYLANDLRWQSPAGSHKFKLYTARFENQVTPIRKPYAGCNILFVSCWPPKEPQERDIFIGEYKYYNADFNASAQLQVGQYWQQDKGIIFTLERMFGDVTLSLTYKNTKLDDQEENQLIGLGFSVPLTPRKDFNSKYFQVRGTPKWSYSVNTLVGESHNQLTPGTGDSAQRFYNLDSAFFNSDRLSKEYIYTHSKRLVSAYFARY